MSRPDVLWRHDIMTSFHDVIWHDLMPWCRMTLLDVMPWFCMTGKIISDYWYDHTIVNFLAQYGRKLSIFGRKNSFDTRKLCAVNWEKSQWAWQYTNQSRFYWLAISLREREVANPNLTGCFNFLKVIRIYQNCQCQEVLAMSTSLDIITGGLLKGLNDFN